MVRKILLATAMLAVLPAAPAQEGTLDLKHSVRLEYQYGKTGSIDAFGDQFDLGRTDTHVFLLSADFALSERWKVFGSIPYVRKRHQGAAAHDLSEFITYTPPDLRIVDDGQYHGGFQDLYVGTRYLAVEGPLSISPHISFGGPVSDYPVYGNAIIGKHLWELPVGVSAGFTPSFSDWSFHADITYVFSEDVMDVDLNYWLLYASASYFVTPRFAPRVFLVKRDAPNALDLNDFGDDYDNEAGYHHDRTLKHSYLNAGIGFDYIVSDRYSISATYYETIKQDVVANLDSAFSLALTHRF